MNKTSIFATLSCVLLFSGCQPEAENSSQALSNMSYPIVTGKGENKKVVSEYRVPSDLEIDQEPNAVEIRYGQRLLSETKRLLPQHVGSHMNCNSCHIAGGKVPGANPYINTYNNYPKLMPRPGKEIDLVGRINGCFKRSMNGKPLKPDSQEMKAMIAYMKWLGQNVPKGQRVDIVNAVAIDKSLTPNPQRGKVLYEQHCATCHGSDGAGKYDDLGNVAFPPLWGDTSFNIGAGMARTFKAAAFIKAAMPMSVQHSGLWGEGKLLSDQDAVDIAEYFTHQPRPDFAQKHLDWPNGNKPKDARY